MMKLYGGNETDPLKETEKPLKETEKPLKETPKEPVKPLKEPLKETKPEPTKAPTKAPPKEPEPEYNEVDYKILTEILDNDRKEKILHKINDLDIKFLKSQLEQFDTKQNLYTDDDRSYVSSMMFLIDTFFNVNPWTNNLKGKGRDKDNNFIVKEDETFEEAVKDLVDYLSTEKTYMINTPDDEDPNVYYETGSTVNEDVVEYSKKIAEKFNVSNKQLTKFIQSYVKLDNNYIDYINMIKNDKSLARTRNIQYLAPYLTEDLTLNECLKSINKYKDIASFLENQVVTNTHYDFFTGKINANVGKFLISKSLDKMTAEYILNSPMCPISCSFKTNSFTVSNLEEFRTRLGQNEKANEKFTEELKKYEKDIIKMIPKDAEVSIGTHYLNNRYNTEPGTNPDDIKKHIENIVLGNVSEYVFIHKYLNKFNINLKDLDDKYNPINIMFDNLYGFSNIDIETKKLNIELKSSYKNEVYFNFKKIFKMDFKKECVAVFMSMNKDKVKNGNLRPKYVMAIGIDGMLKDFKKQKFITNDDYIKIKDGYHSYEDKLNKLLDNQAFINRYGFRRFEKTNNFYIPVNKDYYKGCLINNISFVREIDDGINTYDDYNDDHYDEDDWTDDDGSHIVI